jgi:tetratricopeptide (TPR) repeat protein
MLEAQKDNQAIIKFADDILKNQFQNLDIVKKIRDVYEKSQLFDKALTLTSYLELRQPDNKDNQRALARLYSKNNRWEDTFATSQAFIKSTPTPAVEDLEIFAESALKTNRVDIAISVCQNILKKDAHNTKALILLGESFMHKGDIIKAIQHMENVVEMIPEEPETWLTLARLWDHNGQKDRSFEILNKGVLALPGEPKLLRSFGKALLDRNSPAEALPYLEKAYEIDPEDLQGRLALADAQHQLGHFDAAWQLLAPFEETYPQYPAVSKLLGKVMLDTGREKSAEPVLIFAADQYPEDIDIILTAARLIINKYENSFEEVSEDNLVRIYEILKKALDISPSRKVLKLHLADIERLSGNFQTALDQYKALSDELSNEKSSINWRLNYGIGKTSIALGEYDMGLAALQDAGSEQPENLLIIHGLVEAYQAANLQSKAMDLANTALRLAPQDITNILWFANFKTKNNEPEEAVNALREALRINPDKHQLKLWLAKILLSIGDHEEAKQILSDLTNLDDTSPEDLHQAAYTCVRMNELALAVEALEKAVERSTTFNLIRSLDLSAAYTLVDQEKKALDLFNHTQDYHDIYPQISLMKSDILTHLGQYQIAFNTLKSIEDTVMEGLQNNGGVNKDTSPLLYTYDFTISGYLYRMGQLNLALGDFTSALAYLTQAADIKPADEQIRHAIFETQLQLFNFDEIQKASVENHKDGTESDSLGVNQLDIICSKAEILVLQGEMENAASLINGLSSSNRSYPLLLPIRILWRECNQNHCQSFLEKLEI